MISLLVAMDRNRVIGLDGDMPWNLPNDLKYFKEKTMNHTIIMGRKTFTSLGRVLPKRKHVVLTRNMNLGLPEEVVLIHDIEEIKNINHQNPDEEYFVIGGGKIFEQVLPFADRMYITLIDEEFEGDVYFPKFDEKEWKLVSDKKGEKNERNPYNYTYLQYDRK